MSTQTLTTPEILKAGLQALRERLGPAGMVRFLQVFETGRGDYTAERHQWLDSLTVDDIVRSIEERRAARRKG